ncbi:MAG TPA: hypothetical protein VFV67_09840 [Actinophytocola sp.]|uniref:hypothetical protein n=1 Tax=Actinophytocola sp. TaxID=1872138 RepID=UPI002DB943E9|nr:hypothetical protein [Actinophytocola sp.]HEU5470941.1 hypothetical protein [Actinophytocola sp.]
MLRSVGRVGSAILEKLLPQAQARACTDGWCETSSKGKRCCKLCTGGTKVCTAWTYGCPNGCANY